MKQSDFMNKIGKSIKITCKTTGWIYRGKLIDCSSETIELMDVKIGKILISLDEVALVEDWKNGY